MSGKKNKHSLDHARHNEDVCRLLLKQEKWDWVVTTAFYAALHYVTHHLFPLTVTQGGKTETFSDFDAYYKTCGNTVRRPGKHRVTSRLVEAHIPSASSAYNYLKDASWTARYNEYRTTEAEAQTALARLEKIKDACSSLKVTAKAEVTKAEAEKVPARN